MKRALLVGIDTYDAVSPLMGCVNDVHSMLPLLARNEDGSPNFVCQRRTSDSSRITRSSLLTDLSALFAPGADVGLFYFAGHAATSANDLILYSQDTEQADTGVAVSTIVAKIQASPVREILLLLDCCFAGAAGENPQFGPEVSLLRPGVSILAAARRDQTAQESTDRRGLFSTYVCGALDGGAADVVGKVTMAGVYAYLSEAFGPWNQRPVFKANVERLHELRYCSPSVPLNELRQLPELFPTALVQLPLDPSFEPTAEPKNGEHEKVFAILQRCRAAKLVEPVGAEHMYDAAMDRLSCRLTPLGRLYWMVAKEGRL